VLRTEVRGFNTSSWFLVLCSQRLELCSLDQLTNPFKPRLYAVATNVLHCLSQRKWHMTHIADSPTPKLPRAPQPPLSHPGATADSDRARKPPLSDPAATDQELNPGDRVEGLGDFGRPTGEFGTVEQANEEDAVVKWDDDGRMRLHQPWLKKV
jgi:hypothetical protein